MPNIRFPRRGSMQYWPRKRAKRIVPRVRSWPKVEDIKLLGFLGYKVGMTSVIVKDDTPNSMNKGKSIVLPVTVIECPPIKILSVRLYKRDYFGLRVIKEVFVDQNKYIKRRLPGIKKQDLKEVEGLLNQADDLRVVIYTQPHLTGIGKKTPDLLEIAIGGNNIKDKFEFVKSLIGKSIYAHDVFQPMMYVDIRAITKGKGYQGPVKRFGVTLRSHKSEKTRRGPGSLGPWNAQGHIMYRVAHAGQMGYHQRIEYNKLIIAIGNKPNEVNIKGGFVHYGIVRNPYILIKGSVPGTPKRPVVLTYPHRKRKQERYILQSIDLSSNQ